MKVVKKVACETGGGGKRVHSERVDDGPLRNGVVT